MPCHVPSTRPCPQALQSKRRHPAANLPPQLNAIMGASGGGKTSLLDVLADRKDDGAVKGTILIDGMPLDRESFKHNSGYVVQDDIVMGTVRSCSRSRIPSNAS